MSNKKYFIYIKTLFQEMLLYSGQFALFYLVMQFIVEKNEFFNNVSHVALLCALFIQTIILSNWGEKPIYRMLFSFFVPLIYSFFEFQEGTADLLNAAHIGFWVYAVISIFLMLIKNSDNNKYSMLSEILLVIINVFIFLFLYFYFDTWKEIKSNDELTILRIFKYAPLFLRDPTHWFIIYGGSVLAITLVLGRIEITTLKDKIYSLFGKYVDENVRDIIIYEGKMDSKRLNLCILFSDIKDFTNLCEKYDPSSITEMLNIYFEQWNIIVKKHNGIVDKYIGDAIMVIFGFTNNHEACNSAVLCGIEMKEKWNQIKEELIDKNMPIPTEFGIGCHFGDLIFGDIGSSDRKNFTVIGDTVNIASRLEAASRQTKSNFLISTEVIERLPEEMKSNFLKIGILELKGKQIGIETWCYETNKA